MDEHTAAWLDFARSAAAGGVDALRGFRAGRAPAALLEAAEGKEISRLWLEAEEDQTGAGLAALAAGAPTPAVRALAAAAAKGRLWAFANETEDADLLLRYAELYAGSAEAGEARARADVLDWTAAEQAGAVELYERYLARHPDGARTAQARVKAERLAWARAEERDDPITYRWYLHKFPDGGDAATAEQRALDLEYFRSPLQGEHPRALVNQVYDPRSDRVRLYVEVRDRFNNPVTGLAREDFRVYERGRRCDLVDFLGMESNRPVDVVVLVDVSGSMSDEIEGVRRSIASFAERLRSRQRDVALGLVTYVRKVERRFGDTTLTRDPREFQSWVGGVAAGSGGVENPIQAIHAAMDYEFRPGAQRIFVLVTDEAPNLQHDPESGRDVADAAQAMADAEVGFYAIAPASPSYRLLVAATRGRHFDIDRVRQAGLFLPLMQHIASTSTADGRTTSTRSKSLRTRRPRPPCRCRAAHGSSTTTPPSDTSTPSAAHWAEPAMGTPSSCGPATTRSRSS